MIILRVVHVALDPMKYVRIRKTAYSIKKCSGVEIEFDVMVPKVIFVWRASRLGRLFVGIINYLAVILQIMFVKADVFRVASCPDILALPVVLRRRRYVLEYRSPWSLQVKQEFGGSSPLVKLSAIVESIALKYAEVITLTISKLVISRCAYFTRAIKESLGIRSLLTLFSYNSVPKSLV